MGQILLQEVFEVTNIDIYHAVTKEKPEKKSSLFTFKLPLMMKIKGVL